MGPLLVFFPKTAIFWSTKNRLFPISVFGGERYSRWNVPFCATSGRTAIFSRKCHEETEKTSFEKNQRGWPRPICRPQDSFVQRSSPSLATRTSKWSSGRALNAPCPPTWVPGNRVLPGHWTPSAQALAKESRPARQTSTCPEMISDNRPGSSPVTQTHFWTPPRIFSQIAIF